MCVFQQRNWAEEVMVQNTLKNEEIAKKNDDERF